MCHWCSLGANNNIRFCVQFREAKNRIGGMASDWPTPKPTAFPLYNVTSLINGKRRRQFFPRIRHASCYLSLVGTRHLFPSISIFRNVMEKWIRTIFAGNWLCRRAKYMTISVRNSRRTKDFIKYWFEIRTQRHTTDTNGSSGLNRCRFHIICRYVRHLNAFILLRFLQHRIMQRIG